MSVEAASSRLTPMLDMRCLFIAHQVRIPDLFLYETGQFTDLDHCFHEFDSLATTHLQPNEKFARSISEFIDEVGAASKTGWKAFDPYRWKARNLGDHTP
jgi:hypothetical protein